MLVKVPFGKGVESVEVDDKRVQASLEPSWPSADSDQARYISQALAHPVNSPPVSHLASGSKKVVILTSDNTRPVPSSMTLPALVSEVRRFAPDSSISLLVGTGLHVWSPNGAALRDKYGEAVDEVDEVRIHDAKDADSLASFGTMSTGNELRANALLSQADLILADGFIEGHFFAGFTGGPKSVLPGVSGAETIMNNHSPKNIDDPNSRTGIVAGNPIHEEINEAAKKVNLRFIVNVVLDKSKRIVSAFAGDVSSAHARGMEFSLSCCRVSPVRGDIVITSNGGYPLDRNLYQLVKGISNGALTAADGGVIVACGECMDGVGHEGFSRMISSANSPAEFLRRLRAGEIWEEAQWEAQILAKVLEKYSVIVVSRGVNRKTVESMHMVHAKSLREGLEEAFNLKPKGKITLLPDGPSTIPL